MREIFVDAKFSTISLLYIIIYYFAKIARSNLIIIIKIIIIVNRAIMLITIKETR